MQVTLEKLDIVDYAEETDFKNSAENLIVGCIDTITDILYATRSKSGHDWRRHGYEQLEFTARAILVKYDVNLESLFGKTVTLHPTEKGNISRILSYFAYALGQTDNLGNLEYSQDMVNLIIQNLVTEAYIMITGVLQYFICQQKPSSSDTLTA